MIVLTMSGALLDKAGWGPRSADEDETYPELVALVGAVMVVVGPLVWGPAPTAAGQSPLSLASGT